MRDIFQSDGREVEIVVTFRPDDLQTLIATDDGFDRVLCVDFVKFQRRGFCGIDLVDPASTNVLIDSVTIAIDKTIVAVSSVEHVVALQTSQNVISVRAFDPVVAIGPVDCYFIYPVAGGKLFLGSHSLWLSNLDPRS